MDDQEKKYIKKVASEIGGAMQQSRDNEVSGLFRDIKGDIRSLKNDLQKFDKKSVNWDNTTRIVYGMVALMLSALVAALLTLILK